MKKFLISAFEEKLAQELLMKINIKSELADNKLKKKLIKIFKQQNKNDYHNKMNEFFDTIHPY